MAVAYVTTDDTSDSASGADTLTPAVPVGTNDGETLLTAIVQVDDAGGSPPTLDAAFTTDATQPGDSSIAAGAVGHLIASSESGSYSNVGNAECITFVGRITGAHATTPVHKVDSATSGSGNPTAPDVTTTVDGCLILYVFATRHAPSHIDSGPADTDTLVTLDRAGGNPILYMYGKTQATAGATGTGVLSVNATRGWSAFTMAIAPAAGGGGGTILPQIIQGYYA